MDIARREDLKYGPNRQMQAWAAIVFVLFAGHVLTGVHCLQELMSRRNELVLEANEAMSTGNRGQAHWQAFAHTEANNSAATRCMKDKTRTENDTEGGLILCLQDSICTHTKKITKIKMIICGTYFFPTRQLRVVRFCVSCFRSPPLPP